MTMSRLALHNMETHLNIGYYMWTTAILLILIPDIPSVFTIPSVRWFATAALALVIWVGTPTAISLTMRPATDSDNFLYFVAWDLQEPVVCGKIEPRAIGWEHQRGSSNYTYLQSDCYRNLSVVLNSRQLCANIKSAGIDRLVGSVIAKSQCQGQKNASDTPVPPDTRSFVRAMRSLGYDDEYLRKWVCESSPGVNVYKVNEDQYWEFFWYLAPKEYQTISYAYMQERASIRRDFLARVLAMK
ncbi:MAG: hypothetical protein ACHQT6_07675 [Candidatus Acidiferrales bacterium]